MSELEPSTAWSEASSSPPPEPRGRVRLILGVIAVAVLACGAWALHCLPSVTVELSEPASPDANAAPEEVARHYLNLRSVGRSVDSVVWRPERLAPTHGRDDLRGITDISVDESREDTAAFRPPAYRELAEIRELRVEYSTTFRSSTGEPPGRASRFVLLGRENADARWLVLEIGTGP